MLNPTTLIKRPWLQLNEDTRETVAQLILDMEIRGDTIEREASARRLLAHYSVNLGFARPPKIS